MNNAQTESDEDIENVINLSIKDHLRTSIITNDYYYLSEKFGRSFAHDKEIKKYTAIIMDQNFKNETDDFTSALNSWVIGGGADTIEDDFGFQDDNESHVDSDYSEIQFAELDNPFAQPNLPDFNSGQFSYDDIKYDPSELMLIPPSGSATHFNYNISAITSPTEPPPDSSTMMNIGKPPLLFGNQSDMCNYLPKSTSTATSSATASNYSENSSTGCLQPNKWHPNAAFTTYISHGSTYARNHDSQSSQDHMVDMFNLSNSGREARNRAEKNRRDKLNAYIQELSKKVPHVAESPRRVDKTAVLRFATHGLRLRYVFGNSLSKESTQATDALMKLLDSFFLTLTCNGQIVLVSSSIEQHLGHCQTDLYGQNILHITHPEDHLLIKEKLIPTDIDNLFDIQPVDESGEPRQRTQAEEDEIDRRLREDKRSFTIRMARSGPKSEPTTYDLVKIEGSFRRSDMAPRGLKVSTFPTTLQLMRRSRGRDDIMPLHAISGNDIVLIAIARIVRPPILIRNIPVNRMEYKTRHLIDGRIIDCDQRISIVAGYMTDEVRNLSPFTFIHQDDVRWVIVALRQMYDCHSSYGESTYRLFTRNGKMIYLHTKGFLEIDKNNNKVHSFTCINTLLDEEEGKRRVENMKKKFSVIINTKIPQSSDDVPACENPQQLENAVLCLIQNLKSNENEDSPGDSECSLFLEKPQTHPQTYQHYSNSSPQRGRSMKTPPLALVPPATDSVRNSITKSVNVVKTTAAKFLHSTVARSSQQQNVFDSNSSLDPQTTRMPGDIDTNMFYPRNTDSDGYVTSSKPEVSGHYTHSGAVKRKIPHTISKPNDDEYIVPMQRQAIENVLCSSLQQINNRLNQQLNTALELREQGQRYEVPHTEERIADIMKEHQEQQEMYKNITNEFEVQRRSNESGSIDSGELHRHLRNDLEREEHHHQQQHSTQSAATSTNLNSVTTTDAQLYPEPHF